MPDPEVDAGTTEVTEATSESTEEVTEAPTQEAGTTADTSQGSEESFFDPSSLGDDPNLLKAYKQMQGQWTRANQSLKDQKDKIAAYDAFQTNPRETLERLATQYGLSLQEQANQEFEPQTWDDVRNDIKKSVLSELQPLFSEIQTVKQASIESQLDEAMPEWREYETEMTQVLSAHPTMANDPVKLAELAIPAHVREGKAMQKAMRKLEQKAKASSMTSGTATPKGHDPLSIPKNATFSEYVTWARKKVAADTE